MNSFLSAGW